MQWCDVYEPKVITIFFQSKLKCAVFSETHVSLTESFDFFIPLAFRLLTRRLVNFGMTSSRSFQFLKRLGRIW